MWIFTCLPCFGKHAFNKLDIFFSISSKFIARTAHNNVDTYIFHDLLVEFYCGELMVHCQLQECQTIHGYKNGLNVAYGMLCGHPV